ncbi:MAG: ABC transporter ATP-binding protein [Desulfarculus sp.]|jgi:ABC-type bacteriocin/lantibiotic exporter with double-glycine peptidase domain|nr:MAG: ABC transporter ATP-binding protein [Desulfarculus sp.]
MKLSLFLELLRARKRVAAEYLGLMLILPPLEAYCMVLIYLIVSPGNAAPMVAKLSQALGLPAIAGEQELRLLFFAVAVACVGLFALGRWWRIKRTTDIRFGIYEETLRMVMEGLLQVPPHLAAQEDLDNFSNVAVNLVKNVSVVFFSLLSFAFNLMAVLVLTLSTFYYTPPAIILLAMALGVFSIVINRRKFSGLQEIGEQETEVQKDLMGVARQVLQGLSRIKFDMLEPTILERVHQVASKSRQWRASKMHTREAIAILGDTFSLVSIIALVTVGLVFYDLEAGIFIALLMIFNRLRTYVYGMQFDLMSIRESRYGVEKVGEVLARMAAMRSEQIDCDLGEIKGLRLRGVDFSFPGKPVLKQASLELTEGDRVLVQGPSGQGKSTLLLILAGYLPPQGGSVQVASGQAAADAEFANLRRLTFYTSNDLFLFPGSVRQSLDPAGQFSEDQLRQALSQVLLLEEVEKMPGGLEAQVGDDGEMLSLGQRQRLLLARLFLRHPSLVLLDEATSNVDPDSERKIFQNVLRHLDSRAILVVASHRHTDSIAFNKAFQVHQGAIRPMQPPPVLN